LETTTLGTFRYIPPPILELSELPLELSELPLKQQIPMGRMPFFIWGFQRWKTGGRYDTNPNNALVKGKSSSMSPQNG